MATVLAFPERKPSRRQRRIGPPAEVLEFPLKSDAQIDAHSAAVIASRRIERDRLVLIERS